MTEHSPTRQRIGVAAIAASALALPLTASITYAQAGEQAAVGDGPAGVTHMADGSRQWRQDTVEADGSHHTVVIRVSEDGNDVSTHVVSETADDGGGDHAAIAADHAAAMADYDAEMADLDAELSDLDAELTGLGPEVEREVRMAVAEARAESRAAAAEGRRAAAEVRRVAVMREGALSDADCLGDEPVVTRSLGDGRQAMIVCRGAINAHAIAGLRAALAEVRAEQDMPGAVRDQIIRQLMNTILEMERGSRGAFRMEVTMPYDNASARLTATRAIVTPPPPPMPPAPPVAGSWTGANLVYVPVPRFTVRLSTTPVATRQKG